MPPWGMLRAFVTALVVGVVLIAVTAGCERRTRTGSAAPPDTAAGPTPTHVSYDTRFSITKSGTRRAILVAERMEQYDTEDSTYTRFVSPSDSVRVLAYVFDEKGDSSAVIEADRMLYQERRGEFDAFGDVVVTTPDGRILRSEQLTWHQSDRKIRTRRFVRITTPTERVRGNGLVAEEDLSSYSIGRFSAEVEVDEDE